MAFTIVSFKYTRLFRPFGLDCVRQHCLFVGAACTFMFRVLIVPLMIFQTRLFLVAINCVGTLYSF